jgi:hypothetical protein
MPVDWKTKESYQRLLAAMVAASKDMKVQYMVYLVLSALLICLSHPYLCAPAFEFSTACWIQSAFSILLYSAKLAYPFQRHPSQARSCPSTT